MIGAFLKKIYIAALLGLFITVPAKAYLACPYIVPVPLNSSPSPLVNPEPTPLVSQADQKVCGNGYAWGFSTKTNVNVYAAEHITKDQILKAREMRRFGTFDNRDPLIQNYRNSGYDRGHMAPSGDMGDYESQVKTFVPQNLVPQTRQLNSGKWNWIEGQVRQMAVQYGEVYAVTGPYFQGRTKTIGKDNLWVPYATWKAIYIPSTKEAGIYFCRNTQKPKCYVQTVAFFTEKTGIDPFPTLAPSIKEQKPAFPKMGEYRKKSNPYAKHQKYNY